MFNFWKAGGFQYFKNKIAHIFNQNSSIFNWNPNVK